MAAAISVWQSGENRIAHNLIHDAPHQAVFVGGNDHVFEFNEVHHVVLESDVQGGVDVFGNPITRLAFERPHDELLVNAGLTVEVLARPALDLGGRTDLRQALGVLAQLQLLVTNDSGLMHAAAALARPGAKRQISVSRTVGILPESMMSARTAPGPTEGN